MANAVIFDIDNYQRELFPYAYNILGIAEDAEDVIQEVMINWQGLDHSHIENPRAYLVRSVVNRAINLKEKKHRERASYIGQWLPEPVFTDNTDARIDSQKVLTYSMLVLLEQLNAKERAVFILRESFDYSHADIAQALGINEDASRQLYKRGKAKVGPVAVSPRKHEDDLAKMTDFMQALMQGDVEKVERLLASDVQLVSDSNGKVTAARNILDGAVRVRKFLVGIFQKPGNANDQIQHGWVNHQSALIWLHMGVIKRVSIFEIKDGRISNLHFQLNPDKLANLKKYPNLSRP